MKDIQITIPFLSRVTFLEKQLFTKHLAVMIKSGITIIDALSTLESEATSSKLKSILHDVVKEIKNGQTLYKALEKYPHIFNKFYTNLIRVGEESGTLEDNLDFLAKQLAKEYTLRKKIQTAMMYPLLILSATFIMGGGISLFVLPKLVDFFAAFDVELPLPTKILLFFANLMKNYGFFIFAGIIAFVIIMYFILQIPAIKRIWHFIILRTPVIGKFIMSSQLAHLNRNLGTLLKSGVPVVTAVEVAGNTLDNECFMASAKTLQQEVIKGSTIAAAMQKNKRICYPTIMTKMIAVGEKTGKMEDSLLYLGDFYEEEIDNFSKTLTTILEPILLIVIGIVVGFVALAIISPIYELTGSINK